MTDVEKAIKILNPLIFCGGCTTAADKEISSCNECDFFKAKQLALEALEKQIPQKPNEKHYEEIGEAPYIKYKCSSCHSKYQVTARSDKYCNNCGQALDWSEEK